MKRRRLFLVLGYGMLGWWASAFGAEDGPAGSRLSLEILPRLKMLGSPGILARVAVDDHVLAGLVLGPNSALVPVGAHQFGGFPRGTPLHLEVAVGAPSGTSAGQWRFEAASVHGGMFAGQTERPVPLNPDELRLPLAAASVRARGKLPAIHVLPFRALHARLDSVVLVVGDPPEGIRDHVAVQEDRWFRWRWGFSRVPGSSKHVPADPREAVHGPSGTFPERPIRLEAGNEGREELVVAIRSGEAAWAGWVRGDEDVVRPLGGWRYPDPVGEAELHLRAIRDPEGWAMAVGQAAGWGGGYREHRVEPVSDEQPYPFRASRLPVRAEEGEIHIVPFRRVGHVLDFLIIYISGDPAWIRAQVRLADDSKYDWSQAFGRAGS